MKLYATDKNSWGIWFSTSKTRFGLPLGGEYHPSINISYGNYRVFTLMIGPFHLLLAIRNKPQ